MQGRSKWRQSVGGERQLAPGEPFLLARNCQSGLFAGNFDPAAVMQFVAQIVQFALKPKTC